MAQIDVSLIVCTRDRLESLKTTIASINTLVIPPGWTTELVVVDNGSTDGTLEFLQAARCQIPLRVVSALQPGLSRARNAALAQARGRALVWTDDDVIVDPEWLWRMAKPILDGAADAVAGRVVIPQDRLDRVAGTPLESQLGYLAATNWSDWSSPERMVGACMAFNAHVLEKVPEFNERLGAGPDSLGFHEETTFCRQLLEAGFRITGAPEAVVHHYFDVSRLDAASLCRIGAKIGQSNAYVDWHWFHRPRKRWMMLRKLRRITSLRVGKLFKDARGMVENDFQEAAAIAYYDEYTRCMQQPRKYQRALSTPE